MRSSVLGGAILTQLDTSGAKLQTRVYAGGEEIARQGTSDYPIAWSVSHNPVTGSELIFNASGMQNRTELDAQGVDVGISNPYEMVDPHENDDLPLLAFIRRSYSNGSMGGCEIDGVAASCAMAIDVVNMGAGERVSSSVMRRVSIGVRRRKMTRTSFARRIKFYNMAQNINKRDKVTH